MVPSTSLILTKFRPPAARSRTVPRTRLLQRLSLEPGTDLVLVCAPAGYGKTTILIEWVHSLQQAGTVVAWYALDESDNSPGAFGAYLIASLGQALGPGSGLEPVSQMLRGSPEVDLQMLLPTVINAVCAINRDVVLVLDDYHLIRNPIIHQVVEFLLDHRSENLHLAISSRTTPPLSLAGLRAKNRLIELRVPDLRFTDQETVCFLRDTMQLDLSADLSSRLAEQVEGWAAGLQLAALSLTGREDKDFRIATFTGGHRQLVEYLLEEVVNQLPETLQAFLLYSSILERMSAPVCDAVLGMENSAALLKQIEHLNLFVIELDDETPGTNWYRYHHLFQDFLQTWLNRSQPDQPAVLHRKAADWFAAHGLLREAAYHAFRCGDWSFAADFVEKHSFTLIIQSEIATIYEWCTAFPEAVVRSRPLLCIFQGLALAYRFQGKNRARVEARLQQANQALAMMSDAAQAFEINELAAVVQTFLAMIPDPSADAQHLRILAQTRLAGYPPDDPGRFPWLLITGYADLALNQPAAARKFYEEAIPLALHAGLYFGFVEATFHLARLAYSQGQLQESLEICRKARTEFAEIIRQFDLSQSAAQPAPLPALGCLDIAAGCVFLEQNHLEEADQLLRQGLERMGWAMNPYYLMTAYLAHFRLYEIQGRFPEAFACLDQLDTLWPDIQCITQGCRVQARLNLQPDARETIESAREWLNSYPDVMGGNLPVMGLGPIGAAEAYYQANLIWARLKILLGPPQVVQSYLERQMQCASEKGLLGREIELRLIQAQMFHQRGEEQAALNALEKTLIISRRSGHVSIFIQNAVLDDLIHRTARKGLYSTDLEQILFAIRRVRNRTTESIAPYTGMVREATQLSALVEPLSEREMEILCMVASGASNQDIAKRFVITIGTVKSHIHHIFGKLGVRNRTEAVTQARKLHLID